MTPEEYMLKTIQRLIKRRDTLNQLIEQKMDFLRIICRHTERREKEEYIEGSYYNRSEYKTYGICTICGDKKLIRQQDLHT